MWNVGMPILENLTCLQEMSCSNNTTFTPRTKVANSGKAVIARYRIRNFFEREQRYRYRSWKISLLH